MRLTDFVIPVCCAGLFWSAAVQSADRYDPAPHLTYVDVQYVEVARYRPIDGVIEAVNESTVSARTEGVVKAIHFDVNDYVPAGSVIIELDDASQRASLKFAQGALKEAETQLTDAQKQYQRINNLHSRQAISQADFDRASAAFAGAKARVDSARANVEQAQLMLDFTRIKAPYAGVVKARQVSVGEKVMPGTPLMSGLSLDELRVVADLPQSDYFWIRHRMEAQIELPDRQRMAAGPPVFFPYLDQHTHGLRFRLPFRPPDDSGLMPGMLVKVFVPREPEPQIRVPVEALISRSEVDAVYVLDTMERPRLRIVRPGYRDEQTVQIVSGLQPGERVVSKAADAQIWLSREKP